MASEKLLVSLRPITFPLIQTRCALCGLIDMLLENENFRTEWQSVCVACVFLTFLFNFSIKSLSDFNFEINGKSSLSCDRCLVCKLYWWPWCSWWCCKWSIVCRTFLPPIKRSWLLVVFNRDTERSTDKSSNDVSVCERAKLTCFVLQKIEAILSFNYNYLENLIESTLAERSKHYPMIINLMRSLLM